MQPIDSLYVPDLKPALKHPIILKKFDDLCNGEAFILINDHDPIPLFYEMKAVKGDVFEWKKIEEGPEVWKVEIKRTKGKSEINFSEPESSGNSCNIPVKVKKEPEIKVLNVTLIEPKLKHLTIFKYFDALKAGESFTILNDHDPKPLNYQMIAERGNIFTWTYLEKGPANWKVNIKKNDIENEETIGAIVARDVRKAKVFKKYGIDFCCGGKKSLKQVCNEKGLDINSIESELENAKEAVAPSNNYTSWDPGFLADYIYNQHHKFYYREMPVIIELVNKVADHHRAAHPELDTLQKTVAILTSELDAHFKKEEVVVFPFIKALELVKTSNNKEALHMQPSLTEPIHLMESDHEAAGEILEEIRKITRNYSLPADACNSYAFLYKKMFELDEDLQQHIHLENNILFPKALKMEKELNAA